MTRLPLPAARSVFRDDEPVIQSQPLLPGATSPRFGDITDCWDFNDVVRRPANQDRASRRVWLRGLAPDWHLLGRELSMIWFNPQHPALLARGIHLRATPYDVNTVRLRMLHLRTLAAFGVDQQLPDNITLWSDEDFHRYVDQHHTPGTTTQMEPITVIRALHRFRTVLACGGRETDPWPGMSTRDILNISRDAPLKTPVVKPETWFPLVRAAWTYVDTFGPDILKALNRWQAIQAGFYDGPIDEIHRRFAAWLDDPASRVPVHSAQNGRWVVNWSLLNALLGRHPRRFNFFPTDTKSGRARRRTVEELAETGRVQVGLLPRLAVVERTDGTRGPWHESLQPQQLHFEALALRNACYCLVVALSMMRDSEIREIFKGSVVEYFGTTAVKSTKQKLDPDLPTKHWWIVGQVARAIETVEQLSPHPELAFGSVPGYGPETLFDSGDALLDFIRRVNEFRHVTGLDEIPPQHVAPHMFRRTMAMLTRDFPGSEIAVGMQLKHVATRALANRTTAGYMVKDPAWAKHLDDAIAERRFDRLKELFAADSRGETIGFGPGADRMREAFAAVRQKAEELRATGQAQRGDIRVEHSLLRRTRFSIRFGMLNHCTMNDDDPSGAKCIEDAIVPEGHRGPLLDRCQPSRCANSILGPEHLPIWKAERSSLNRLRADTSLPRNRRTHIDAQLHEVNLMIKKAEQ
ncbi:hypothetical protein [Streptomyces sp. NPDC052107]|uniref:hypothetical protein n=1 Tax=Streptomyces sp. NPDC052107 TaxID=3155632 RepID=UPI00342B76D7